MGDHLATIDNALFGGELGPHLTQCGLGRCLPVYQVASWSISRLAATNMDRKLGAVPPFFGGRCWVPIWHNVAWAKAYLHTKCGILIHPAVWPQYAYVTDRTERRRSDRIGRTVLQTVAQKSCTQKKRGVHKYGNYLVSDCNCLFWTYNIAVGRQNVECRM